MSITLDKKLGFGAMRLPLTDREDPKSIDLTQFRQMVDLFFECGLCEKNCPQHIAIRDMLEEFAALYEA